VGPNGKAKAAVVCVSVAILLALVQCGGGGGSGSSGPPTISSFAVSADLTVMYPNLLTDPNHLQDLPDEHSTFIPTGAGPNSYLVFSASKVASGPTGGAVVLQTSDLQTFAFATGYNFQVFVPPVAINACNPTYDGASQFDENYAAPGSVVQDPTLPAGNFIMLYEAENHCPGTPAANQQPFYATVGFARSADSGKTWPSPVNAIEGDATRHPVLKSVNAQPATGGYTAMGNAIPSAFVDRNAAGDYTLYVVYDYFDGGATPATDGLLRVARAKLGTDPLVFQKWFNGSFSQPGLGGLDSGVLQKTGCTGRQDNGEISYNDDLGQYLFVFVCESGPSGSRIGAWYYSTATSLDAQNWTAPQLIQNSQFAVTRPCPTLSAGGQFDGWYPSFMSPGAAAGHTRLTGLAFFMNGCNIGSRQFMSRTFTITTGS